MGIAAKSDPYVKVEFMGSKRPPSRTTYIRKELNPVWNAQFSEDGKGLFAAVESIRFEVYDRDQVSKDDLMGTCVLPVLDPKSFYSSPVQWVKLVDEEGNMVVDKDGKESAIQVNLRYAPKV